MSKIKTKTRKRKKMDWYSLLFEDEFYDVFREYEVIKYSWFAHVKKFASGKPMKKIPTANQFAYYAFRSCKSTTTLAWLRYRYGML